MDILHDASLKPFNTLKIDVSVSRFCRIKSIDDLITVIGTDEYLKSKKTVLGGGSNIVLLKNIDGYVLHNEIAGIEIESETDTVVDLNVGGGENWHKLVQTCVENGWGGIENLALIPGTVGGAPVQNIGAYGVELKDVLLSVNCVDLMTGEKKVLSNADCQFDYRDSVFKHKLKNKYFIFSVLIRLHKFPKLNLAYGEITQRLLKNKIQEPTLIDVFHTICAIRTNKLPDPAILANAGSFFKNPIIPYSKFQQLADKFKSIPHYPAANNQIKLAAGWLIEQAGWKGRSLGPVRMFENQALVLINNGGNGQQVLQLAEQVKLAVGEKFQIELEIEPELLPSY